MEGLDRLIQNLEDLPKSLIDALVLAFSSKEEEMLELIKAQMREGINGRRSKRTGAPITLEGKTGEFYRSIRMRVTDGGIEFYSTNEKLQEVFEGLYGDFLTLNDKYKKKALNMIEEDVYNHLRNAMN